MAPHPLLRADYVAVNLAAAQLAEIDLVPKVLDLLATWSLEPRDLCIELTESQLMADADQASQALADLHATGIRIAIDDFGTGYSSLAYLRRFPVDVVKLDRSFIADVTSDRATAAIVQAVVGLADALGVARARRLPALPRLTRSPRRVRGAAEPWDCFRRCQVERALFGIDHAQVLARCLRACFFPEEFAEAVECHADASRISPPLGRCLSGATALGPVSMFPDEQRRPAAELVCQLTRRFELSGVDHQQVWGLSRQARHDAATLAASFAVDG